MHLNVSIIFLSHVEFPGMAGNFPSYFRHIAYYPRTHQTWSLESFISADSTAVVRLNEQAGKGLLCGLWFHSQFHQPSFPVWLICCLSRILAPCPPPGLAEGQRGIYRWERDTSGPRREWLSLGDFCGGNFLCLWERVPPW